MPVEMANIRVPDLWNKRSATMMQETTNWCVTDQHAEELLVSVEDDKFLLDNNILFVTKSDVQRMNKSGRLR